MLGSTVTGRLSGRPGLDSQQLHIPRPHSRELGVRASCRGSASAPGSSECGQAQPRARPCAAEQSREPKPEDPSSPLGGKSGKRQAGAGLRVLTVPTKHGSGQSPEGAWTHAAKEGGASRGQDHPRSGTVAGP